MDRLEKTKHRLIERIKATTNTEFLEAIDELLSDTSNGTKVEFSAMQISMLKIAEDDIKYGRVVPEEEIDSFDK